MNAGRRILGFGLCLAATAVLLAGCGGGGTANGSGTPRNTRELLVTQSEIKEAGASTPTGVLLTWWQALQFNDAKSAVKYYAPGVVAEARVAAQLQVAGAPVLAKPEVQQTQVSGKKALLYAVIVAGTVTKKGQLDTITQRPVTLRMARRHGRWLFTDNSFLAERAAAALASKHS